MKKYALGGVLLCSLLMGTLTGCGGSNEKTSVAVPAAASPAETIEQQVQTALSTKYGRSFTILEVLKVYATSPFGKAEGYSIEAEDENGVRFSARYTDSSAVLTDNYAGCVIAAQVEAEMCDVMEQCGGFVVMHPELISRLTETNLLGLSQPEYMKQSASYLSAGIEFQTPCTEQQAKQFIEGITRLWENNYYTVFSISRSDKTVISLYLDAESGFPTQQEIYRALNLDDSEQ